MLEEEEGGFAGFDVEVLLNFLAFAAAEGRIGEDNFKAVFFLNVVDVSVRVFVWRTLGASIPWRIIFMMAMT